MYAVSDAFKVAMKMPVQKYRMHGIIASKKFDESNILAGSFSITNQNSDSSRLSIGQVFIGELTGTFYGLDLRSSLKKAEITPVLSMRLADDSYEDLPLGVYTISSANWGASGVEIKAYDHMTKFDKSISTLPDGGTPWELIHMACENCGVELALSREAVEAMPNGTLRLQMSDSSDVSTWRDLLSWVCQILCCNATAGRDGKILLQTYKAQAVDTLDARHRLSGGSFSDFSTRYTGISRVDQADGYTRYASLPVDDGLTYNLGTNPFLQSGSQAGKTGKIMAILEALSVINYVPFKTGVMCPPVYDLGDCILFPEGIAKNALGCINKFEWTFNSSLSLEGFGEDPSLATANSKTDKNISGLISANASTEYRIAFSNGSDVSAGNDGNQRLVLCAYIMNDQKFVIIHGEAVLQVETTETVGDEDAWEENDVNADFFYKIDGQKAGVVHPTESWTDGSHTIHFLYSIAKQDAGSHTFEVWMHVKGGKAKCVKGGCRIVVDSVGLSANTSYIVVAALSKTEYTAGEVFDPTGLVVTYYNGNDMTTLDVTKKCKLTTEAGSDACALIYSDPGTYPITVTYEEEGCSTSFDTYVGGLEIEVEGDFYESDLLDPNAVKVMLEDGGE